MASLGVTKIGLIHSYISGKRCLINLDGHVCFTGTNAAGKSSLLNLLPAFYGFDPRHLTDTAAGKGSFVDYYLPTEQSIVAFEYRRVDGPRTMIMYRSIDGVAYRFINAAMDDSIFLPSLRPAIQKGITVKSLLNELHQIGIETSPQITTTTDYRSIIQNDRGLILRSGKARSREAALARQYCLGSESTTMTNIDRMTYVILKQRNGFSALKRMIAETQFRDSNEIINPASAEEVKIINDVLNFHEFSRHREALEVVIADADTLAAKDAQYINATNAAIEHVLNAEARVIDAEKRIRVVEQELKGGQATFDAAHSELLSEKQIAIVEHRERDGRARQIEAAFDEWAKEDIDALADAANQLEQLVARKGSKEQWLEEITKKSIDNEDARKRAITDEKSRYNELIAKLHESERIEQAALLAVHAEQRRALDVAGEKASTARTIVTERHSAESNEIRGHIIELNAAIKNTVQTEAEETRIRFAQEAEDQARTLAGTNQQKLRDASNTLAQRELSVKKSGEVIQGLRTSLKRVEGDLDRVVKDIGASESALIGKLRAGEPGWENTLGKVLTDAALLNPGLKAVKLDDAPLEDGLVVINGWRLDPSPLKTTSLAGDIADKEFERERLITERGRLAEAIEKEESALVGLRRDVNDAKSAEMVAKSNMADAEGNLSRLSGATKDIQAEVRLAVQKRKEAATAELALRQKEQEAIRKRQVEELAAFDLEAHEQKASVVSVFCEKESAINSKIRNIKAEISCADADLKDRIQLINSKYDAALDRGGVSVSSQISAIRAEISNIESAISRAESASKRYVNYTTFIEGEYVKLPAIKAEAGSAAAKCAQLDSDITALRNEWSSRKTTLNAELDGLRQQKGELQEAIKSLQSELSQAGRDISPRSLLPGADHELNELFGKVDEMRAVTQEMCDLRLERGRIGSRIERGMSKVRQVLARRTDSHIYRLWMRLSDESGEVDEAKNLKRLIRDEMPQYLYSLTSSAFATGTKLMSYFGALGNINKDIRRRSRELGDAINKGQQIASLQDIEIHLSSRVNKQAFWRDLETFARKWAEWSAASGHELPPEDLANLMASTLASIRGANDLTDINGILEMEISLKENGRQAAVRNDSDFANMSSNGLSQIALSVVLMGMSRFLCRNPDVELIWPMDEIGQISGTNMVALMEMFQAHNIKVVAALPDLGEHLKDSFRIRFASSKEHGFTPYYLQDDEAFSAARDENNAEVAHA